MYDMGIQPGSKSVFRMQRVFLSPGKRLSMQETLSSRKAWVRGLQAPGLNASNGGIASLAFRLREKKTPLLWPTKQGLAPLHPTVILQIRRFKERQTKVKQIGQKISPTRGSNPQP